MYYYKPYAVVVGNYLFNLFLIHQTHRGHNKSSGSNFFNFFSGTSDPHRQLKLTLYTWQEKRIIFLI